MPKPSANLYTVGITLPGLLYLICYSSQLTGGVPNFPAHGTIPIIIVESYLSRLNLLPNTNFEVVMRHVTSSYSTSMYIYSSPCGLPSRTRHQLQGTDPCKVDFLASQDHEHIHCLKSAAGWRFPSDVSLSVTQSFLFRATSMPFQGLEEKAYRLPHAGCFETHA